MITADRSFNDKLAACPGPLALPVQRLVELIEDVAKTCGIDDLEQTLKWGELAFLSSHGSTIRVGWVDEEPPRYALYFNCNSKLVETIRTVYPDVFVLEGNRAMVFQADEPLPEPALRHSIELALNYHKLKHLPLLGA